MVQRIASLWIVALCLWGGAVPGRAAETDRPPPPSSITLPPAKLDRAIGEVLQQREYTWRLPREKTAVTKQEQGWLGQFIESVFEVIEDALKKVGGWMDDLWRWIFKPPSIKPGAGPVLDWTSALKGLLVVLILVCVAFLAFLLFRVWQRHQRATQAAVAVVAAAPPNLADDNVAADQLPEDGWLRLGRELMAGGDPRLALRAFYLASLAHLAERNLITLARFKSNRDYARELQRRGHALPMLVTLFGENVSVFERVWYGRHDASRDLLNEFSGRVERMRAGT
jgi:hypothetical protein